MAAFFALEWPYGVGTGHPGCVHVFASEKAREGWLWQGEATHKEAVDSKTARLTKVRSYVIHGSADIPVWLRDQAKWDRDSYWMKDELTAWLDDCVEYRRFPRETY